MDSAILWRVAVVQVVAVAVLSLLLALVFSHGFFEAWGWLVGPLTWMLCAWVTARVVGLPEAPVLVRAALAGIPSLLFVLIGVLIAVSNAALDLTLSRLGEPAVVLMPT